MGKLEFGYVKAHEIGLRIDKVFQNGSCTLLPYLTARGCQRLLDECVGSMNWSLKKFDSIRPNGTIHLTVELSLWDEDKKQWIPKCDVGEPSTGPYADKAQFSDAFKRVCTQWGIGRELYYCPTIYIDPGDINILTTDDGKNITFDELNVKQIVIGEKTGKVTQICIENITKGKVIFSYDSDRIEVLAAKNEAFHEKRRELKEKNVRQEIPTKVVPVLLPSPTTSSVPPVKKENEEDIPASMGAMSESGEEWVCASVKVDDTDKAETITEEQASKVEEILPFQDITMMQEANSVTSATLPESATVSDSSVKMPPASVDAEETKSIKEMTLQEARTKQVTVGKFVKEGKMLSELNAQQIAWVFVNAPEADMKQACMVMSENYHEIAEVFKAKNIRK